ncbi:MAG: redoxin domain-containing protein [Acidobacteriota bacterium]
MLPLTVLRTGLTLAMALATVACAGTQPDGLPSGFRAPDFSLPGADGKTHSLGDYSGSRVLAVVFTSNTCPASQLYESRLRQLADDYRSKGVTVVAVNPNRADGMRLSDLSYSDVGETIDDMKVRAADRHLDYPYLSDGQTQALVRQFRVVTTPHIFVFDQSRTLRYDGRIDDAVREDQVTSRDARSAIDALLAGKAVADARTAATGCAVKGLSGPLTAEQRRDALDSAPVTVEMADADALKQLRRNGTGKLLLVNFWATWCAPCASEFPDLEATYRMYRPRGLEFATVSVNDPEERGAVLDFLKTHRAAHRNLQFATSDVYALQAAFDPNMPAPVPFTLLIAPGGDVLYQELGELTVMKLRRAILASLPETAEHPGLRAYWSTTD